MNFRYINLILILFLSHTIIAQSIKVIDNKTGIPIPDVFIYSTQASALTDLKGEADISDMNGARVITFQHPSYTSRVLAFDEIKSANFRIVLTENVFPLGEVIISASRWEQERTEIANKISTITPKDIQFNNPQTSADLMTTTGFVFVQKSQMGGGSPMIRGLGANRILIVVDGVRMNNAIFRSGNLQNVISVDPLSLKSAEVIFGPGTVIYGSDALGGVMDFHTVTPTMSTTGKPKVSGNALLRYSTANQEKTGHFGFNIGLKKWAFLTDVTYSGFEDLKMGTVGFEEYTRPEYVEIINGTDSVIQNPDKNVQVQTGYNQLNLIQKIMFKPSQNMDITYSMIYSATTDIPRYDRLIEYRAGKLRYAEWYYGPQKWFMNSITLNHSGKTKFYDNMKMVLASQNYEESRHDRKFNNDIRTDRTENVNIMTLNLDFDKKLEEKTTIFYGIESGYNKVGSKGEEVDIANGTASPASTRYPDGAEYAFVSAYGSVKYKFNEQTTVNGGLRYNYTFLSADFDSTFYKFPFKSTEISNHAFNGSLGLAWQPGNDWQVNINGSSGFRAPNVDDAGKVFDSEPGNVVVPNPDLSPEYAYNVDLGLIKTFNGNAQFEITGFYTWITDAMVRGNFTLNGQDSILYDGEWSKVQAMVNANRAYYYGVQAALSFNVTDFLTFKTYYNYVKSEKQDEGGSEYSPIRYNKFWFGSSHLLLRTGKFRTDLYSLYNGEIKFKDLGESEQAKTPIYAKDKEGNPYSPGWVTLNVKLGYQFSSKFYIDGGIENLTDIRYRPFSSGVVSPGRNFIISASYKF